MNPTAPKPVNVLPRSAILAIAAALLLSLVWVASVRLTGTEIRQPDAAPLVSRSLRFDDGPDGSVLVFDAATGQQAMVFTGEQGFLRGALRALARDRKRTGAGAEQPFELVLRTDNRLTLTDTVTGQRIDLESFGPTNAGLFAQLLPALPAGNGPPSAPARP